MRRFVSFICMLTVAICASAVDVDNVLVGDNSTFEGGTMGSWFGWSGAPEALAPGYNSEYCLHVQVASTGSAAWSNQIAYDFAEPLTPNTYYLNVMAKGTGTIQLVLQSASYGDQVYGPEFQLTSDWQEFTATMNVTTETDVQFRIYYGKATEVFLDNIEFGPKKQGLDAGDYYLFNVEAKAWLGGGNSWGTQALFVEHPWAFGIAPVEGGYTIDSYTYNNANDHFFGRDAADTNFYIDAPVATWTIEKTEGGYYLKNDAGLYAANDGTNILAAETEPSSKAVWKLFTKEDLLAKFPKATTSTPIDATFLLPVANFDRNHAIGWESAKVSPWQVSADCTNKNLSGGNNTNNCAESWHSTFDIYQELTNVPNGWYRIDLQGFYRQDGSDNDNLPYFYANDAKSYIAEKTGTENSMSDASNSFSAGKYQQKPVYVEVNDGNLRIGIKNETNTNLWVVWDNFEISYYGDNFYPQPDPAQTTLVDDGSTIQYLYNEDAKGFFLGANEWNTRASVGSNGYQFKVTKNVDGATWTLNDYVETQTTWKAVFADNASSICVDNLSGANVHNWIINILADGKFTIANPSVAPGLLGKIGADDTRLYLTEDSAAATTWYAVSEADYAQWQADCIQWQKDYNRWIYRNLKEGDVVADEEAVLANWTRIFTGAGQEGNFEQNTWSAEADESEVRTPFIQSWVWGGSGAQLSAMKIQHSVFEGLPEGSYEVSITARAYNEMAGSATPSGVKFVANGTEVDLSTGKTFTYNNMAGVWNNFVIPATVGTDGVLDFYIDIYEPNFGWFTFKNFKVVYQGEPVGPSVELNIPITTTVGKTYEGITYNASAELELIAKAIGCSISDAAIFAVQPDGTYDSDYEFGTTDGWRNAEGGWSNWGNSATRFACKANFTNESNHIYYIGGYHDGEHLTEPITYTATYSFKNGDAEALLYVNLIYKEPTPEFNINITSEIGWYYEDLSCDVTATLDSIASAIGCSISDAAIFAVQPDGTYDSNYQLGTTDGWRNAEGGWSNWGNSATRFTCKANFTNESNHIYCICGYYEGEHITEPVTYTATYSFKNGDAEALLYVNLIYEEVQLPDFYKVDECVFTYDDVDFSVGYSSTTQTVGFEKGLEIIGCSFDEALLYGYDPNLDDPWLKDAMENYDGWRDVNGSFCRWSDGPAFCLKLIKEETDNMMYCFYPGTDYTDVDTLYATFALINPNDGKACIYKFNLVKRGVHDDFIEGDANNDGSVDVVDISTIAAYILGNTPSVFSTKAADFYKDDVIDVVDISAIANYILNNQSVSVTGRLESTAWLEVAPFTVGAGDEVDIEIQLTNPMYSVSGAQFDMQLPEGLQLVGISGARNHGLTTDAAMREDGSVRVISYSVNNATYDGNYGTIMTLRVKADKNLAQGMTTLDINNVILSAKDCKNINKVCIGSSATAVQTLSVSTAHSTQPIYNLAGQRVGKYYKGIIINNGKKSINK